MKDLYEKLVKLNESEMYPFHMPGHKRRWKVPYLEEAMKLDITEIDGFGNLHGEEGILQDIESRIAGIYKAENAYMLINGSTAGILSAISSAVQKSGKLIMARHSHKSAYNAVYLNELNATYLYPPVIEPYKINGGISPESVKEAIRENPDAEAVFVVSPTYEGVISDIDGIADVTHEAGIPLIVDSAHGAHLGFKEGEPLNAAGTKADIVIESLHKTLPSFTQTGVMFTNGEIVDKERIKRYLDIFQSTSPSYVFMAGISKCMDFLENGKETFDEYYRNLEGIYDETEKLKNISLIGNELINKNNVYAFDRSKLIIYSEKLSGREIYDMLRDNYHLMCEMATPYIALAMTSPCDDREGFDRLIAALKEIDENI